MSNALFESCQRILDEWLRANGEPGEAVSVQFLCAIHGGTGPARGYVFGNSRWHYHVLTDGTVTRESAENRRLVRI